MRPSGDAAYPARSHYSPDERDLGWQEEAQAAISEAVTGYRKLAATQPSVFVDRYASALDNQARSLAVLGRDALAKAALQEAAGHSRTHGLGGKAAHGGLSCEAPTSRRSLNSIQTALHVGEESLTSSASRQHTDGVSGTWRRPALTGARRQLVNCRNRMAQ